MGNNQPDKDDLHAQRAINQLGACRSTLQNLENTIRAMVDDVIITSESGDGTDLLMAWEIGQKRADEMYMFLLSIQEEAVDFTDHNSFEQLDSIKKAEYIDTLRAVQKNISKLHDQYRFFVMVYHIAQTEQIIALLWENLILQRNRLLSGQLDESVGKRSLPKMKKNIELTRSRLKNEIHTILKQLEILIEKKHFSDMQPERKNEFYEMWKIHTLSFAGLDDN